jgi:hypothetical protein
MTAARDSDEKMILRHILEDILGVNVVSTVQQFGITRVTDLLALDHHRLGLIKERIKYAPQSCVGFESLLPSESVSQLQRFCYWNRILENYRGSPLTIQDWQQLTKADFDNFCQGPKRDGPPVTPPPSQQQAATTPPQFSLPLSR